MIKFPDHVAKSLMMKLSEIEDIEKSISKLASKIILFRRRQAEVLGEIKGMLQAEEFENEIRGNDKPETG